MNTESSETAGSAPTDSQGTMLVVDDNSMNRLMLSRHIERQGHRVVAAENGRDALDKLQQGQYDVVLLDVMMPEMDGYAVLEHMKGDPTLRDIPVIMISALDELDSVVRCIELGAQDYLPKPFNPVLLRARLAACLEKKRLRDAEVRYLQQVNRLTGAAAEVEAGSFDPASLTALAARPDELGQLARVFQRMATEVVAREARLKQQVQELRIEIDSVRKAQEVAELTDTDYFRDLQNKANRLRTRPLPAPNPPSDGS
jgi:CheY-like chemotaxis protein